MSLIVYAMLYKQPPDDIRYQYSVFNRLDFAPYSLKERFNRFEWINYRPQFQNADLSLSGCVSAPRSFHSLTPFVFYVTTFVLR